MREWLLRLLAWFVKAQTPPVASQQTRPEWKLEWGHGTELKRGKRLEAWIWGGKWAGEEGEMGACSQGGIWPTLLGQAVFIEEVYRGFLEWRFLPSHLPVPRHWIPHASEQSLLEALAVSIVDGTWSTSLGQTPALFEDLHCGTSPPLKLAVTINCLCSPAWLFSFTAVYFPQPCGSRWGPQALSHQFAAPTPWLGREGPPWPSQPWLAFLTFLGLWESIPFHLPSEALPTHFHLPLRTSPCTLKAPRK